jgi:predicted transcriptional regulator
MSGRRHQKRRTKFDIWASILAILITEDSTLSAIVIAGRLNRERARRHRGELVKEGLIRADHRKFDEYSITEHGVQWLKRYEGLAGAQISNNRSNLDF